MKYRMKVVVKVWFPECAHTVCQVPGDTGILDPVTMFAKPQQLESQQ